jgi:hypothetical protein
MLATFTPIQAKAGKKSASISGSEKESSNVEALISQLREIDPSSMSRVERKEIREELQSLENEVARQDIESMFISGGLFVLITVLTLFSSIPEKRQQPLNSSY